jgi:hypothetical protein
MITSYSRGHKIYFDGIDWRFCDSHEIDDHTRSCKHCGKAPTLEGYDACLGFIDGATSACCGHGVEKGYIIGETML